MSAFICAWLSDQTEHNKMQGTVSVSFSISKFQSRLGFKGEESYRMLKTTIEEVVFRVVFMEELHYCISHMVTKPRDLICCAKNGNCFSKTMNLSLVYLAVAEGNLFSNRMDSGAILRLSRQH